MSRPLVITRVQVFTPDGSLLKDERTELRNGSDMGLELVVAFSKRDHWVRYDDGERTWECSGLPFVVERTEQPL
jgi:hypothetical protein